MKMTIVIGIANGEELGKHVHFAADPEIIAADPEGFLKFYVKPALESLGILPPHKRVGNLTNAEIHAMLNPPSQEQSAAGAE